MGWGDLIAESVREAQDDMATVESAAMAIQKAISNVQPWLTSDTWRSPEATAWIGDWQSFYNAVQSCLNSLPAAEAQVVAQVRTSMEKMARQHAGQPAPS
jgi:predicted trehalose synthase